ncbi:gibberellin 2-beta-dioxygenase 8-like [Aristolochia californica]|uniref:gibberellin 2-beta-dioxygenase 8-like n=1 Tax=Aristolochia californica TaxID=171875 RepID=UPI0035E33D91
MDSNPPLEQTYETLVGRSSKSDDDYPNKIGCVVVADGLADDLPLVDLGRLALGGCEREACKMKIVNASKEWGFFQVNNHGIAKELLDRISVEQIKAFRQPFEMKLNKKLSNFSPESYRWGAPTATSLQQLSWSEAFHIPLAVEDGQTVDDDEDTLRPTIEEFAEAVSNVAQRLAKILAEGAGDKSSYFEDNCSRKTCYLRLNRYPPCPISREVFGLMPHTDSDFITVLYQDQVGGLQLLRDGRWITVKPIQDALIVNIGDLFQAWSNGAYKSVEHRVMTNSKVERFSVAYFMCPSYDTVIESFQQPSMYRKFSFREFREQVQDDVKTMGCKIGLPRFLNGSMNVR